MKWGFLAVALVLGGCASVSDIEQTHPTLSVISGKKPAEYAECVSARLAEGRDPIVSETRKDGVRLIIPQKLTSATAAIIDIEERSGGSSIKVFESLSNNPLRPQDVRHEATRCISKES